MHHGVQVRTGDPLIRFDMDLLAERAKSLITPIVIVNEGYRIALLACDRAVTAEWERALAANLAADAPYR